MALSIQPVVLLLATHHSGIDLPATHPASGKTRVIMNLAINGGWLYYVEDKGDTYSIHIGFDYLLRNPICKTWSKMMDKKQVPNLRLLTPRQHLLVFAFTLAHVCSWCDNASSSIAKSKPRAWHQRWHAPRKRRTPSGSEMRKGWRVTTKQKLEQQFVTHTHTDTKPMRFGKGVKLLGWNSVGSVGSKDI